MSYDLTWKNPHVCCNKILARTEAISIDKLYDFGQDCSILSALAMVILQSCNEYWLIDLVDLIWFCLYLVWIDLIWFVGWLNVWPLICGYNAAQRGQKDMVQLDRKQILSIIKQILSTWKQILSNRKQWLSNRKQRLSDRKQRQSNRKQRLSNRRQRLSNRKQRLSNREQTLSNRKQSKIQR